MTSHYSMYNKWVIKCMIVQTGKKTEERCWDIIFKVSAALVWCDTMGGSTVSKKLGSLGYDTKFTKDKQKKKIPQ